MQVRSSRTLIVAIAALLLLAGCSRSAQGRIEKGNQLFAAGKYQEAELEYRNAIQKDPNLGEAQYRLGLTEIELNRGLAAYQPLRRAVELMPDNVAAKVKLADVDFAVLVTDPKHPQRFYDEVGKIADQLLVKDPSSFDGLRLKGSLQLVDRHPEAAIPFFEKADRTQPNRPDLAMSWVQALFEVNRFPEGENLAARIIQKEKGFAPMYDVLYRHYMSLNRTSDAESILKAKVANNPTDLGDVLQLARHYAAAQNATQMDAVLQRVLSSPKDFPNAKLRIGDFYASLGQWTKASSTFEAGEREQADQKEKLVYQKRMADALLAQGKNQDARRIVDQILKDLPNDPDARKIRATIWLRSGLPQEAAAALSEFQALVVAQPGDAQLRFLLAQTYLNQGYPDKAENEFREVVRQRPNDVSSRLALADISLRAKKPDEAIRYANEILAQQPQNRQARLLRVTGMIAAGHHGDAQVELVRLAREDPKSADVQYELALLAISEKKFSEAEGIFRKLSQSSPADQRSVAGLAEVYTAQNQMDKALELLSEDLKRSPDSRSIHRLLAETEARAHKYDAAIAEYNFLLTKDTKSVDLRMELSQVYKLKGDLNGAITVLQEAQQLAPNNPEPPMQLASLLENSGRSTEALAGYRRALELRPDNPFVMNSVAFLLAETGGNLDEALSLVQRAFQKAPGHPMLTDTLGWIYIKKGNRDSALRVYTNLVRAQPKNPEFRYHFAVALLEKGDKKAARTELQAALQANPASEMADKIKAVIKQLE